MKGLLIRNMFSVYRKNEKLIIMMLLVNAIIMTMFDNFSFLSVLTVCFAAALVQDQIYDDRKNGYLKYEGALPLTSKEIVLSEYISAFVIIFIGAAASILSVAFVDFMFDYKMPLIQFIVTTVIFAYLAFVLLCILFPFYYRFGTKYIRLVSIALLVIPTVVNYFVNRSNDSILSLVIPPYLIIILSILSFAIIGSSMLISLKIAEKNKSAI